MIVNLRLGLIFLGALLQSVDGKQVCYGHVGCFNNDPPYDNAQNALPKSPADVGTQITLYTPTDSDSSNTVHVDWTNNSSLSNTRFDPTLPVKVVIHGFSNTNETEWLYLMKDALMKTGRMNVLIVTWGPGAAAPDYHQAVANTRLVAKQTSMLLSNLNALGAAYKNMHLIGHSLGSHISGNVGRILREGNFTLGRISGMDPAEPDFQDHPLPVRLDKNDADFVDVIHTNGKPFSEGGFGMQKPCGHVDFYINGGLEQPDCPATGKWMASIVGSMLGKRFLMDSLGGVFNDVSCSHSRSHDVFIESINPQDDCLFTAYPCGTYEAFQNGECLSCGDTGCGIMGYYANEYDARGSFYLNTRFATPFCGHHYGVTVTVGGSAQTTGKLQIMLNSSWGKSEWMNLTGSSDVHFKPGDVYRTVALSKDIVGSVQSVSLRFTRSLTSRNEWLNVDAVTVESGDSGITYMVCVQKALRSGHVVTITVDEDGECPT